MKHQLCLNITIGCITAIAGILFGYDTGIISGVILFYPTTIISKNLLKISYIIGLAIPPGLCPAASRGVCY